MPVAPHDDHLRSPSIVLSCSRLPRATSHPANSFSHSTAMDGASFPPFPPPPQALSLIASLLMAAASAPNACAVVRVSPAAIEALNVTAAAALRAVRGAVQDVTPPKPSASSVAPAASAPAVAAISTPSVRAVTAPAAPSAQRRDRGWLMPGENIFIITQVAERVPLKTLALRCGVTKRAIYDVWAGQSKTWDAAARGMPLGAHCVQVCRSPLIDQLLDEWLMRIRSMVRKTMPISRIALQAQARQLARLRYPEASSSASDGFINRSVG